MSMSMSMSPKRLRNIIEQDRRFMLTQPGGSGTGSARVRSELLHGAGCVSKPPTQLMRTNPKRKN